MNVASRKNSNLQKEITNEYTDKHIPSLTVIDSPSFVTNVTLPLSMSIFMSPQPETHGLPQPRATTAACEVMPIGQHINIVVSMVVSMTGVRQSSWFSAL